MSRTAHRDRATGSHEPNRRDVYELANTTVVLEPGPAGIIARIERHSWHEYAGPLPVETVESLAEVAHGN